MVSLIPQVKTRVLTQKFKISKQKVDGNELGAVSGKEKTVAGTKELFESLVVIKVGRKGVGRKKIWVGKLSVCYSVCFTYSVLGSDWYAFYELSYLNCIHNCDMVNTIKGKKYSRISSIGNIWDKYLHSVISLHNVGKGRSWPVILLNQASDNPMRSSGTGIVFQIFPGQSQRKDFVFVHQTIIADRLP